MRIDWITANIQSSYSGGRYEEESIKAFLKEDKDPYLLKISCKKMTEMTNDQGWDFIGIKESTSSSITYIFERSK